MAPKKPEAKDKDVTGNEGGATNKAHKTEQTGGPHAADRAARVRRQPGDDQRDVEVTEQAQVETRGVDGKSGDGDNRPVHLQDGRNTRSMVMPDDDEDIMSRTDLSDEQKQQQVEDRNVQRRELAKAGVRDTQMKR